MVVDLEIDKLTYEIIVRNVVTAQDVGKAINPLFVEGQIIGGTSQALGYALLEKRDLRSWGHAERAAHELHHPDNARYGRRWMSPSWRSPYSKGPFGAKGVGELPMDVPAPAVAAAVYDATGLFLTELPILPEKLCQALHAQEN